MRLRPFFFHFTFILLLCHFYIVSIFLFAVATFTALPYADQASLQSDQQSN